MVFVFPVELDNNVGACTSIMWSHSIFGTNVCLKKHYASDDALTMINKLSTAKNHRNIPVKVENNKLWILFTNGEQLFTELTRDDDTNDIRELFRSQIRDHIVDHVLGENRTTDSEDETLKAYVIGIEWLIVSFGWSNNLSNVTHWADVFSNYKIICLNSMKLLIVLNSSNQLTDLTNMVEYYLATYSKSNIDAFRSLINSVDGTRAMVDRVNFNERDEEEHNLLAYARKMEHNLSEFLAKRQNVERKLDDTVKHMSEQNDVHEEMIWDETDLPTTATIDPTVVEYMNDLRTDIIERVENLKDTIELTDIFKSTIRTDLIEHVDRTVNALKLEQMNSLSSVRDLIVNDMRSLSTLGERLDRLTVQLDKAETDNIEYVDIVNEQVANLSKQIVRFQNTILERLEQTIVDQDTGMRNFIDDKTQALIRSVETDLYNMLVNVDKSNTHNFTDLNNRIDGMQQYVNKYVKQVENVLGQLKEMQLVTASPLVERSVSSAKGVLSKLDTSIRAPIVTVYTATAATKRKNTSPIEDDIEIEKKRPK